MKSEPIRVMVVDDHPAVQEALGIFLNSLPDVQLSALANTGLEAIQRCQEELPDVILMDLTMSRMDGIDASRAILERFPQVKIIILSIQTGAALERAAIAAGATAYISKNSSGDILAQTIREAVRGPGSHTD